MAEKLQYRPLESWARARPRARARARSRTAAEGSGWVAGPDPRGGEAVLWFIIRDNRGGVSWTSRRVQVR